MTINWADQRTLILAPHPDDEVIGCGGLISRISEAGGQGHVMYLTIGADGSGSDCCWPTWLSASIWYPT
ncbi:hypothetical protein FDA94_04930 [Herbidospora galbida]|uniref:PIG-L family deacetylase n=1 Tax=Herbidospora galbida TaxID=2575442 RepID=A0A4U3MNU0_9ACTN|nr:PIG-L family deacetylase [Herbidospora galbida]TKK90354.1 hypothetical protein FDA94_04930 [Herbidospora galbida]